MIWECENWFRLKLIFYMLKEKRKIIRFSRGSWILLNTIVYHFDAFIFRKYWHHVVYFRPRSVHFRVRFSPFDGWSFFPFSACVTSPSYPSRKHQPGWKIFKTRTATTINTPSRTMNNVWFLINSPLQPCASSMTRKMLRMKMHTVASANAATNPLNFTEGRKWATPADASSSAAWGFCSVRMAKSRQIRMNMASVSTWNASPATMIWVPVSGDSSFVAATLAMPPPVAWSTREMISQGMKNRGNERGLMREFDAPTATTIRERLT